ncbi:hypothetical protein K443DRAFT_8136 [Laccaria amethystina LaAM-08-1]|uniref:DEAD/DEAH-box helicase domain-containing protein n=1 Tax=Laccaria amethystina LaAM-08-1 TaxID=1095629 RepID=A0A0C9XDW3_9AGAR|nr:hypothetical protein K443DRAFT_8136 [Laccaria amethystina LaAM-08-1]
MLASVCTRPPDKFSWTSLEGRTVIREILEERIPQWTNGPRPAQLDCWLQSLAGRPTILIASTGWGKTTAFFVPILVLRHLVSYPKPRIPRSPSSPVALVVTPLIELGNAHASEISDFGLTAVSLTAESLQAATRVGRNLLKEVCEGRWSVVLLSAERLVSSYPIHYAASWLQEAARGSRLQITHVMLKRASFLTEMTEGTQPPKLPQNGTDLISLQIDCHL